MPRLAGSVQGVVVQIRTKTLRPASAGSINAGSLAAETSHKPKDSCADDIQPRLRPARFDRECTSRPDARLCRHSRARRSVPNSRAVSAS